jgi:V8-like Glu-specific endopeptidase
MAFEISERKKLLLVMAQLFQAPAELSTFLRDDLGRNLNEISLADSMIVLRSKVVDNADRYEWLPEMVEAMKQIAPDQARAVLDSVSLEGSFAKPRSDSFKAAVKQSLSGAELLAVLEQRMQMQVSAGNVDAALANAQLLVLARVIRGEAVSKADLRKPLEDLGLLTATPGNLQQLITESNSFLELGVWLSRLTEIEGQVCRIGIDTGIGMRGLGTGFLVGPSTVLTNHHVIAAAPDPKRLRAQFDYRVLKNGSVEAGRIVEFEANRWLIAARPASAIDGKAHPIEEEPSATELDFALVRLAEPVGAEPIAGGATRGWMDLTTYDEQAEAGAPVFIVQHPSGTPLKLAIETNGIVGYSPNALRVRYRTNTMKGSSGSPVFNQDLELIALHHAGDPEYDQIAEANYNEGIPITTLRKYFEANDLMKEAAV